MKIISKQKNKSKKCKHAKKPNEAHEVWVTRKLSTKPNEAQVLSPPICIKLICNSNFKNKFRYYNIC